MMASKSKQTTPDTCRLTLTIRSVDYRVTPVPHAHGRAWKLRRADGKGSCVVAEGLDGPTCSCLDSQFRHSSPGSGACKHIRACRALGLAGSPTRPDRTS